MTIQQYLVDQQNPPPGIAKSRHKLIWTSIEKRHHVCFFYDGKERISEPHDYGIQNGRVRLLVYQFGGESKSGRLPAWRLVDVEGISKLKILNTTFPGNLVSRPVPEIAGLVLLLKEHC
jgi:hypothetical protein